MLKKIFWTAGLVLVLTGAGLMFSACGGLSSDAAVSIDGKEITKDQVARRINVRFNAITVPETPIGPESLYYQKQIPIVTEMLVAEEMDRREAEKRGISVSDEEIAAEKQRILEDNFLSDQEYMEQHFADVGATDADLREQITGDLLHKKIVDAFRAEVTASEEEALAEYNANLSRYVYPERRQVRQIVVADELAAQSVAGRLAAGESMDILAQQVSIDTKTAPIGGRLDLTTREQLPPAVAETAFSLPLFQVSEPFQSDLGWYVIRVDLINSASNRTFDEVKDGLIAALGEKNLDERLVAYEEENNGKYDIKYAEGYALN